MVVGLGGGTYLAPAIPVSFGKVEPVSSALQGDWPYQREQPEVVTLGVRPGVAPSTKPPVRIFLGTEDGQYRAERIFVYSVAKHRDPARVYEIHLMKNLAGFNRRGWRTGFTCYRFAIPSLAGDTGKAIYNDVDQIYLADPALLFDLDPGSHGYLAISARDTSVMLIDCERMLPWWNRAAASPGRKGELTNRPAETPGLWGELDGHWNARDLEYAEGRTKCLHYTALHQQPWNPFPEQYSYHPNPLAYLWHDLERQADAEGFEVFDRATPSPGFLALVGSNQPAPVGAAVAGSVGRSHEPAARGRRGDPAGHARRRSCPRLRERGTPSRPCPRLACLARGAVCRGRRPRPVRAPAARRHRLGPERALRPGGPGGAGPASRPGGRRAGQPRLVGTPARRGCDPLPGRELAAGCRPARGCRGADGRHAPGRGAAQAASLAAHRCGRGG